MLISTRSLDPELDDSAHHQHPVRTSSPAAARHHRRRRRRRRAVRSRLRSTRRGLRFTAAASAAAPSRQRPRRQE